MIKRTGRVPTTAFAATLMVVGVVLVFACAGGGTTTTAAPSTTTTASADLETTTSEAPETTSTYAPGTGPIKVGAPLPLTGTYASDGDDMQMGLQMAVDDLNAAGGLLGRPVELDVFDTEELLPETLDAAKAYLVDQQKVDVVIEPYGGSGPDFEAFGANSDVPFIHGTGSAVAADLVKSDPAKYGNMFQVSPVEAEFGKRAFEGVTQFQDKYPYPNKKIAIVHGDQDWDRNYAAGVVAEAEKAGWQVVVNEEVPYGTSDWSSVLTKIKAEQPAAIVTSILSVDDITSFVQQFMQSPTRSLMDISYVVTLDETQTALGKDLTGLMGYVNAYVTPSKEHNRWKAQFKDKYGVDVPLTNPPSAYDSVMLWAEAVKAVGDPTEYADIQDYIKTHTYSGLLGLYDFNNPEQTVKSGTDFPIAYAQYKGDGKLAFYGVDKFTFPAYITPAFGAEETTTTVSTG
jgi:branched-chain amino acid transport system substrate-binding protein